ncbi:MAG: Na+/H+ antiporter subunit E [Candidatus Natronoplasma sp.]
MKERSTQKASIVRHYHLLDLLLFLFWILITGLIFNLLRFEIRGLSLYSLIVGLVSVSIVSYLSHVFILHGEDKRYSITGSFFSKLRRWSFLLTHLFFHLFVSSVALVRQTVTKDIEPKVVEIPVELNSESELTLLSMMITMTPGTLVLKTEKTDKGYLLETHFSYLPSKELDSEVDKTIKRWERSIRGLFE